MSVTHPREEVNAAPPALSVIVPASNEADYIGDCLGSLLASDWDRPEPAEVIVVANGCRDDTASLAEGFAPEFQARGWSLRVLDRKEGGKAPALNAGDRIARAGKLVYLDADVIVAPGLLQELADALDTAEPRYASGSIRIPAAKSAVTRAYARIYRRVPFMAEGVPGCGLFAVNAAGRMRWQSFPDIVSDDTFVRLQFAPNERVAVNASYEWPLVEGWRNLVRVRRRQNLGVAEIRRRFPQLCRNEGSRGIGPGKMLRLAVTDPAGFAVYAGVALAVKLASPGAESWSRGR